jgi:hypothetical protein
MKVGKIPNLAICGHRPCTDCCEKITKGFEVSRDEKYRSLREVVEQSLLTMKHHFKWFTELINTPG